MGFGDSKERCQNAGSMGGEAQARDFRRARLRTEQEPQGSFGPRAAENEGGGAGDTAAENGVGANFNVNDERASSPNHHQVHPHVVIAPPAASAPAAAARVDALLEPGPGSRAMDARHAVGPPTDAVVCVDTRWGAAQCSLPQGHPLVHSLQPLLLALLQQPSPPPPPPPPHLNQLLLPNPHLNRPNDRGVPAAPVDPGPSPRSACSPVVIAPVGPVVDAPPAAFGGNGLEVHDSSSTTPKTGRHGGGSSFLGSSAASSGDGAPIHLATRHGSSSTTKKGPPSGGSSPPGANKGSPSDGMAIHPAARDSTSPTTKTGRPGGGSSSPGASIASSGDEAAIQPAAREGSSSTAKKGQPGGGFSPPGANDASPSDGAPIHLATREDSSSTAKKGPPGGGSSPPGANEAYPSDGAAIHPAARGNSSPTTKSGQPGGGSSSPRADAASVGSGAPIHRRAATPAPTANGGRVFEKSPRATPAFHFERTFSDSPPDTPVDIRSGTSVAHRSPSTELQRKRPASSAALSSPDSQRQLVHSFASGSMKSFDASDSGSTPKRPKTIASAIRSWGSEQIEGKQKRQLARDGKGPGRRRGPKGAGARTTAGAATAPPPSSRTKLLNGTNVQSGSRTHQRKNDVQSFDSPCQSHGPQTLYPEGTRLAHWFIDEFGTYRPFWGEVYGVNLDGLLPTYRVAYDDGSADEWTEEAIPDGLAYAAKIKGGIPADAEKRLKAAVEKARDELSRIMAQEGSQGTPASVASIRSAHDVSFTDRESRPGATVEQSHASIATAPSGAAPVPPSESICGALHEAPDSSEAYATAAATELEPHGTSSSSRCSNCELFGLRLFGQLEEHKVSIVIDDTPGSRESGGLFSFPPREADTMDQANRVRSELCRLVDEGKFRLVSKCGGYDSKMPMGCLRSSSLESRNGSGATICSCTSFEQPIRFTIRIALCPVCHRLLMLNLQGLVDHIFTEQELHEILDGGIYSVLDRMDYSRAKSILDRAGMEFAKDGSFTSVKGRVTVLGALDGNLAALEGASLPSFQAKRPVVLPFNIYENRGDCFRSSPPLSLALRKLQEPEGLFAIRNDDTGDRVWLCNALRRTYGVDGDSWFRLLEEFYGKLPYGISVSAVADRDSFLCTQNGISRDTENSAPTSLNKIPRGNRAKALLNDPLTSSDGAGEMLQKNLKEGASKSLLRIMPGAGFKWSHALLNLGPVTHGKVLEFDEALKPTSRRL